MSNLSNHDAGFMALRTGDAEALRAPVSAESNPVLHHGAAVRPAKTEREKGPAHTPVLRSEPVAALNKFASQPELLRKHAWDIGAERAGDAYAPPGNHAALAMISPHQGFAHWRIRQEWIDETARQRGGAWQNCRLILRLYDVTFIEFNGFNAHAMQDIGIGSICGHQSFHVQRAGTTQLAEVGFLLRSGEFIAAARSPQAWFAPDGTSGRGSHAALMVDEKFRLKEVANLWEQENFLRELAKPKLKANLKIATFAFEAAAVGHKGLLPTFVSELAQGQAQFGHSVTVFMPAGELLREKREVNGVMYVPVTCEAADSPLNFAFNFARGAEEALSAHPAFDLFHLHEWMTGLAPWIGTRPTVLSLTSIEKSRLNGAAPDALSAEIAKIERDLVQVVECVLTPDWLRTKALEEFAVEPTRIRAFPMEGRVPTEWEAPLDTGKIKQQFGLGVYDRLLLYVGPLEYDAGLDVLMEALPVACGRCSNLRIGMVGLGSQHDHLLRRAHELGVGHVVRTFGDVGGERLTQLLRASEALVLPSRRRVHMDEAVVHLARKAAKPVVTTHGGPSHLVKHEHDGVVTYDNPGSMVWALDRILHDPNYAARLGQNGKHGGAGVHCWKEVARSYLDLCLEVFPELAQPRDE